jgi:methyl-accepting chemotaxis protein
MRQRAIKRAAIIAIVVGSLLNVINQYDAIFLGQQNIDWLKIVLTYCVPFGVSLFSGWLASRDAQRHCN